MQYLSHCIAAVCTAIGMGLQDILRATEDRAVRSALGSRKTEDKTRQDHFVTISGCIVLHVTFVQI